MFLINASQDNNILVVPLTIYFDNARHSDTCLMIYENAIYICLINMYNYHKIKLY